LHIRNRHGKKEQAHKIAERRCVLFVNASAEVLKEKKERRNEN